MGGDVQFNSDGMVARQGMEQRWCGDVLVLSLGMVVGSWRSSVGTGTANIRRSEPCVDCDCAVEDCAVTWGRVRVRHGINGWAQARLTRAAREQAQRTGAVGAARWRGAQRTGTVRADASAGRGSERGLVQPALGAVKF
ncbi:hypothetical protein GUJ93_ZPchr0009g1759 [Zizania palustris]|uniref:Uncharacterized protein n=1 Tax=Zizania palustris TaxID=103762 RepID=A0A8J5RGQ4_ZIZPA|nr:hypothetical protein GUJ93_ZPchr0009g1759 [Zizania palustris]